MKARKEDIYGGGVILSYFMDNKYPNLADEFKHYSSITAFNNFNEKIDMGLSEDIAFKAVILDITRISKYIGEDLPEDFFQWIKANFYHMEGIVNGTIEEAGLLLWRLEDT